MNSDKPALNFEDEDLDTVYRDDSTRTTSEEIGSPLYLDNYLQTAFQSAESKPSSGKRKPGRKKLITTLIISGLRTKKGNCLRKEYIVSQIIRGEKKLIRQLKEKCLTRKSLSQYDLKNQSEALLWVKLKQIYECNQDVFNSLSSASCGQSLQPKSTEYRSYNKSCCRSHYEHIASREFHYFYVLLTFGMRVTDPSALCQKFKLKCCSGLHNSSCIDTWERVRQYVLMTMIKDLDLHPFKEGAESNREIVRSEDWADLKKRQTEKTVSDCEGDVPLIGDQDFLTVS